MRSLKALLRTLAGAPAKSAVAWQGPDFLCTGLCPQGTAARVSIGGISLQQSPGWEDRRRGIRLRPPAVGPDPRSPPASSFWASFLRSGSGSAGWAAPCTRQSKRSRLWVLLQTLVAGACAGCRGCTARVRSFFHALVPETRAEAGQVMSGSDLPDQAP